MDRYVVRYLKKRPFGNIRMYVAALKAASADGEWDAIAADVEKAAGSDLFTKIKPFL
jgi:hypothetical protein